MLAAVGALALGACDGSGGGAGGSVVARAGGQDFTVATAAELLAPQPQLPNQPEVVDALANLWIDYFLLARVAAEDTTLANLEVGSLVDQQINQELVMQLRERVIQVDTAISEEELQRLYERDQPGGRVRARHILLRVPEGAADTQVDSVRAQAESLRTRALGGEDFAALAQEFSQDPGSGSQGGDLGTFGRGEMVPPFEAAAFALEVGEISPVVETPYGFHVIRVEEKVIPPLDESRDLFRTQLQARMMAEAESLYVARIVEEANIQVDTETYETIRQLAADPGMELGGRALGRPMVTYEGGGFTVGEVQDWLRAQDPNLRAQVKAAPDEQLDGLLRNLTRGELLVNAARGEGIDATAGRRDSLTAAIRDGVKTVARQLDLLSLTPAEGESAPQAAHRAVLQILRQVVQEGREVFPLGGISLALRKQYGAEVFQPGLQATVDRVEGLRSQMAPAPSPLGGVPGPGDTLAPDTAGDPPGGKPGE